MNSARHNARNSLQIIKLLVSVILAMLVTASTGNAIPPEGNVSVTTQVSLTEKLVDTAGEVLLEAAEFGLDWVGEKLLGSRGWDGFKRILSPVVARLEKKFPALRFGRPGDSQAAEAANQAVAYLKSSPELHKLLSEGFMSLQSGQAEILESIDRMERLMTAQHEEQMKLMTQMYERISDGGALPRRVDVSDVVDRLYLLTKARARRDGKEFNEDVMTLVIMGVSIATFMQRVLEEGKAFVRYEANIANAMWYATPSAVFEDEGGRRCRKVTTDYPVLNEPKKRHSSSSRHCQMEGYWIEE